MKYLLFIKPFTRANLKIVTSSLTELLQVDRAKLLIQVQWLINRLHNSQLILERKFIFFLLDPV